MRKFLSVVAGAMIGLFGSMTAAHTIDSVGAAVSPQIGMGIATSSGVAEQRDWRPYFDDISKGGIVISIDDFRLSYWSPGAERFMEFPIGAPKSGEFERRGRTRITEKVKNPGWTPTADMRRRDPSLPAYMGPGPENPLGTRKMRLGWPAYLIHGTNAPMTIGRKVSSGCFRMFPQHVELLYDYVEIGTPVYVY